MIKFTDYNRTRQVLIASDCDTELKPDMFMIHYGKISTGYFTVEELLIALKTLSIYLKPKEYGIQVYKQHDTNLTILNLTLLDL